MSLIKCKDCGREMSSEAKACPQCGAPPPKRTSPFSVALAILVTIVVVSCIAVQNTTKVEVPVASAAPKSLPTIECDKAAARIVESNLRTLASWESRGGRIEFRWGPVWYEIGRAHV